MMASTVAMTNVGPSASKQSQMSCVVGEARLLTTRMLDRDKIADNLLVKVQSLNEKINAMREVCSANCYCLL